MTADYPRILQEMAAAQSFEKLEVFKDPSTVKQLNDTERTLLADLFFASGKQNFSRDEKSALETFHMAFRAVKDSSAMRCEVIRYALEEGRDNLALLEARDAYAHYPEDYEVALCLALALLAVGEAKGQESLFQEAQDFFILAEGLAHQDEPLGELYYAWGHCLYEQGLISQEAVDFRQAGDFFAQAKEHGCGGSALTLAEGKVEIALAELVSDLARLEKGISHLEAVVNMGTPPQEVWYDLGRAYATLYSSLGVEDNFLCAYEAFSHAVEEEAPYVADAWFYWGQLLIEKSYKLWSLELLNEAQSKLEHAHALEGSSLAVIASLAEVYIRKGLLHDELDTLRQAEALLVQGHIIQASNKEILCQMGFLFLAYYKYFEELNRLEEAEEWFGRCLAADEEHGPAWRGMAQAHMVIGDAYHNIPLMEQALEEFSRALECGVTTPDLYNERGIAYMKIIQVTQNGEYAPNAVEQFEHALSLLDPGSVYSNEVLYNYACALDFLGDFEEQEEPYKKSIDVFCHLLERLPEHPYARYNLALAYAHLAEHSCSQESFEKSYELFEQILAGDHEDEMAWTDWGVTLITEAQLLLHEGDDKEGWEEKVREAEAKLTRAVALGSGVAAYYLSCAYSLMGEIGAAMHFFTRSLQQSGAPPFDDVMEDDWLEALRESRDFQEFLHNEWKIDIEGFNT